MREKEERRRGLAVVFKTSGIIPSTYRIYRVFTSVFSWPLPFTVSTASGICYCTCWAVSFLISFSDQGHFGMPRPWPKERPHERLVNVHAHEEVL